MRKINLMRAAGGLVTAAAMGLTLTVPASAHVTIRPDVNTSGSYAKVTVRVPNESAAASTTLVRLEFPENTFGSVRVLPHPGWTAEISREQLDDPVDVGNLTLDEVITAVTWTADPGVGIGPDEFDEFAISLGPLPDPGSYVFPAYQTYDDGEEVAWDMSPDVEDASNPAPTLEIVEGAGGHDTGDTDSDGGEAMNGSESSDGLARGLAAGSLVVGAVGIGIGALALRRSRG